MAGIDRLAEVMGRDNDLDPVERSKLEEDAAAEIARLMTLNKQLLGALVAFVEETEGTFPFYSLPAARTAISAADQTTKDVGRP